MTEPLFDQPGALLRKAQDITAAFTVDEIHDKTGIPTAWLRKFKAGQIKNPGVNRIEFLVSSYTAKSDA